ncbi:hypothetical protein QYG89_05980 [Bacillus sp. B190/17]|uniref:DUF91 domain-containing protein n=1 Tax=Bacillus lumedeiriae TaxID=3058829 RepID=A0ABW8I7V4_9BACI
MLFDIEKDNNTFKIGQKYSVKPASQVGIKEKDIEDLIADHPEVLFPNEEVLIIGQSIAYKNMADVLALDAKGNLIVVEIKREWSNRTTVGQLLDYASELTEVRYDQLNEIANKYTKWRAGNLYDAFKEFSEREDMNISEIGKRQRVIIVAPQSDEGLKKVVKWLRSYGVPIEFVPFELFVDENGHPKLFKMHGVTDTPESVEAEGAWAGHWIFNTNESYGKGAYKRMFEKNVAAIYGYDNGSRNLEGSSTGDSILAYVNKKGICAVGKVINGEVKEGQGIFINADGEQQPDEYHLQVEWEVIVPENQGITSSEAARLGYNLPVRTVFGKLHKGVLAEKIVQELKTRAGKWKA